LFLIQLKFFILTKDPPNDVGLDSRFVILKFKCNGTTCRAAVCFNDVDVLREQVMMSRQLAEDKQLATSLRWLAKDKKNGFRKVIIHILEATGINHKEWQTKVLFILPKKFGKLYLNVYIPV